MVDSWWKIPNPLSDIRKLQQLHVCCNQNIDGGLEPMREEKAGLCEPVMGEKHNFLSA